MILDPGIDRCVSSDKPPQRYCGKYFLGFVTDSLTYACAAKCIIASERERAFASAPLSRTSPLHQFETCRQQLKSVLRLSKIMISWPARFKAVWYDFRCIQRRQ
jgi:hypothetical protein